MFMPGESFVAAAVEADRGAASRTAWPAASCIATPTTLIALLRAIAYGWRQEQLADERRARSASSGASSTTASRTLGGHFEKIGDALGQRDRAPTTTPSGSLERRVLPAARRFRELGAGRRRRDRSHGSSIDVHRAADRAGAARSS